MIIGVLILSMFSVIGLALADSSVPFSVSELAQTYGGTDIDKAWSVVQTSDGGYALTGYTCSYTYRNTGLADVYLVKTDGSGNMQWNRTYGNMYDECASSIIQTSDGGYALAGYTCTYTRADDAYLVKTNSSGNMQWSRMYGSGGLDFAYSVVQTSDGGYLLAGYTESFGAGNKDA